MCAISDIKALIKKNVISAQVQVPGWDFSAEMQVIWMEERKRRSGGKVKA